MKFVVIRLKLKPFLVIFNLLFCSLSTVFMIESSFWCLLFVVLGFRGFMTCMNMFKQFEAFEIFFWNLRNSAKLQKKFWTWVWLSAVTQVRIGTRLGSVAHPVEGDTLPAGTLELPVLTGAAIVSQLVAPVPAIIHPVAHLPRLDADPVVTREDVIRHMASFNTTKQFSLLLLEKFEKLQ